MRPQIEERGRSIPREVENFAQTLRNVGLRDIERAAHVLDARPAALGADRVICYSIR